MEKVTCRVEHGDCLEVLKSIPDESIDSLVTDPPAGISFMGKAWDDDKGGRDEWIAWLASVMRECHRVMKPGAHGLVWAIPRTSHWTGMALESAGFEVRDRIAHVFGQGFPKSLDISKAIDKQAGAERERLGKNPSLRPNRDGKQCGYSGVQSRSEFITAPATDDAKTWAGWGTALKPAMEDWWLIRKKISEKNVAQNVLKHGTGGINIDGSRIEAPSGLTKGGSCKGNSALHMNKDAGIIESRPRSQEHAQGRFPSNFVLSHTPFCEPDQCDIECAIKTLDEQSPFNKETRTKSPTGTTSNGNGKTHGAMKRAESVNHPGQGHASRFFYCAKISTSERNAGLEELPSKFVEWGGGVRNGVHGQTGKPNKPIYSKNHHPTVKPQKLMRYLINLITPPNGTVLDPFMGSGSTGVAAQSLGFGFIGIEREAEYVAIAAMRLGMPSVELKRDAEVSHG